MISHPIGNKVATLVTGACLFAVPLLTNKITYRARIVLQGVGVLFATLGVLDLLFFNKKIARLQDIQTLEGMKNFFFGNNHPRSIDLNKLLNKLQMKIGEENAANVLIRMIKDLLQKYRMEGMEGIEGRKKAVTEFFRSFQTGPNSQCMPALLLYVVLEFHMEYKPLESEEKGPAQSKFEDFQAYKKHLQDSYKDFAQERGDMSSFLNVYEDSLWPLSFQEKGRQEQKA